MSQSPAKRSKGDNGAAAAGGGSADERDTAAQFAPLQRGHISNMEEYRKLYKRSVEDPDAFWGEQARQNLSWFRDFDTVCEGSMTDGDLRWFNGGQLNVSYNCLDRHIKERGDKVAIIHEGDEPGAARRFTYSQALAETCKIADVLRKQGVRKGDTVAIYLPMVPELVFTMLACARIGAVHSVVFAGFSSDALRDRIQDASCRVVVVADEGKRGGKTIHLKNICDQAVLECPCVEKVLVVQRTGAAVHMVKDRDVLLGPEMAKARPFVPAEPMAAEDPLFLLYTSGSTGKPKGLMHTTAGYLMHALLTTKLTFDVNGGDDEVYACVADCGWITGHTYIAYGPLALGTTTVMFESTPMYPNPGRYWDLVQTHKITQFYTAPTAIRALMRFGVEPPKKYDLSSLRVLGTVGEPINPEAWLWYYHQIGRGKAVIVDTYWQTETGGHVLTPLPGATPTKPGSATLPFLGIDVALVDKDGKEIEGNGVSGMLCIRKPWPSLARTIYGDHQRYLTTYMKPFAGYYFTGDGAYRDQDGYYWITGRVDDVLNVSGHRLGSAEIESALVAHDNVAEAACIGFPHDTKGQGICCYVTLVEGIAESDDVAAELRLQVRRSIGPFATPDYIVLTPAVPKTRSGKIMRRVLRKIISQETDQLGDISTLANPAVVEDLIKRANAAIAKKQAGTKRPRQ